MSHAELKLKGFTFQELFTAQGLARLDHEFLAHLQQQNGSVYTQLLAYRAGEAMLAKDVSELLIACSPYLEAYLIELFDIEDAAAILAARTLAHQPVDAFKKYYVLRCAKRALAKADDKLSFADLDQWLDTQLEQSDDRELAVAKLGMAWLEDAEAHQSQIDQLVQWCVAAMVTAEGQQAVQGWASFKLPQKLHYENLVTVEPVADDHYGRLQGPPEDFRQRDGFALTDPRMSQRDVLSEINYCVYCHKTEGDFCSKGFPVKKGQPELGLKISPVKETMTGCPLEEKISEMHVLKRDGLGLASLAMIMADNPMCPATGHRICNDCMKGCIYQKQEPVNIPEIETRVLTDILDLPWGVEIYDLLTRWNPLRQQQYVMKPYNGLKALVMGMGPAGFTLAHHLLMEGYAVVGVDGLKIEPLPEALITQPIHRYADIQESLDDRIMAGFGGVAEYGITVRWDKNFLKLIYISLSRRPHFQVVGSIRFGGTLTVEDTWALGFDHLALAVGAGLPRELRIPNSLAPGMRQANDFLMALQLTGAAKSSSLANLQVRLPAVVIGGGLTGVDTATEVQVYYIAQVEKTAARYQVLVEALGENAVREKFSAHALAVLDEFLAHANEVKLEREKAAQEQREPDFIRLLRTWGGVTIAYRRTMQESPAYRRNHEEVIKALEEGIYYAEGLEPHQVDLDKNGWVSALQCRSRVMDEEGNWMVSDEAITLPARSIFVATGAQPNVAYSYEHKGTFAKVEQNYLRHERANNHLQPVTELGHVKSEHFGAFTSYQAEHRRVSFLGDTHPIFHGSVVKAIASAKRVYPEIVASLADHETLGEEDEYQQFRAKIEDQFKARVVSLERKSDNVVELIVKAPIAAQHFKPGQFYRIQNYESTAPIVKGTRLQTEALALVGIGGSEHPNQLRFIVEEDGASARLVADFKVGQRLSVMGPTGARLKLPTVSGETLLVVGGLMAAAHVLAAASEVHEAGARIAFVATEQARIYQSELEATCDNLIWAQDDVVSSIVSADVDWSSVVRVLVVGDSQLLKTVQRARADRLAGIFAPDAQYLGSVHGPMQCMLKGVCAQCLQWQIDPKTGQRTKAVYACSWQNQPMEIIDMGNIDERLAQNETQETLTNLWMDYLSLVND